MIIVLFLTLMKDNSIEEQQVGKCGLCEKKQQDQTIRVYKEPNTSCL